MTVDEYVKQVVDAAPPLTPAQVAKLAALLSTAAPVKNGTRGSAA